MFRILLVKPDRTIVGARDSHIHAIIKAAVAPADLTTIAALTPPEFDVEIWDEAVHGLVTERTLRARRYGLVGVGGYTSDLERTNEIGRLCRSLEIPSVVGGVGVTSEPQKYREHFDVLILGEAEQTWPAFLRDFAAGRAEPQYRQVTRVDMTLSPPPRWDLIARDLDQYAWTVVQTTRGCPFDCEFCDVIALFGRAPRHKPIEQVLDEVRALNQLGASGVLLADDNVYGDRGYYKTLFARLGELNATFARPLKFWAQITLNVANDDEMLALLVAANVSSVLIGIESPNVESLIETNKPQNYKLDLVKAIARIQSYGLRIEASLIVGFDHDDETIFDQQFAFIQEACLTPVSIWTLYAMPGTKLWTRLQKERRVLEEPRLKKLAGLNARAITNVVPQRMTIEELYTGYRSLLIRVHAWEHFEQRLAGLIDRVERFPAAMLKMQRLSKRRLLRLVRGLLTSGIVRRGFAGALRDVEANALKRRLLARVTGSDERSRFLRAVIEDAVSEQQHINRFVLPVIIRELDEELDRLRTHGMSARERPVFAVPEAFRTRYKAVFQEVYDRVEDDLRDKSRLEGALVEIFRDFLERWGSTFETFDDYMLQQLAEFCDRTVAQLNGESGMIRAPRVLAPAAAPSGDGPGRERRQLAVEVLRCVEDDFRATALTSPVHEHVTTSA